MKTIVGINHVTLIPENDLERECMDRWKKCRTAYIGGTTHCLEPFPWDPSRSGRFEEVTLSFPENE